MKKNNLNYVAPEILVVDVQVESVLCGSDTDVTMSNPWSGNTEVDW